MYWWKMVSWQQLRASQYKVKFREGFCVKFLSQNEVEVFEDLQVSNQECLDAGTCITKIARTIRKARENTTLLSVPPSIDY